MREDGIHGSTVLGPRRVAVSPLLVADDLVAGQELQPAAVPETVVGRLVRPSRRRESSGLDDHARGRERCDTRAAVFEHEDGIGWDDLEATNEAEFTGAVAFAADAPDPPAAGIVDPDLRGASAGEDDAAVLQACDSSHAMKLGLRRAIDRTDGRDRLVVDAPSVVRIPRRSR
jgi:hypothetical protein